MADNVPFQSATLATPASATSVATDDVAGQHFQKVKIADGTADSSAMIPGDATNGLDVDVTRVQGTVAVSGPLTDAQLRATAVPVSGTVTADSELPAAAALADATANPTTPLVGAAVELFNGTTWDRARGDTANGLDVDVTRVSGTVTVDSELTTADLDTGAGTDTRAVVGLAKAASGGAVLVSDANGLPAVIRTPAGDSAMDDVNDAVRVNIIAGAGSGGTAMTDDAAFTPASTSITPAGAMFDDVTPDSVDEGDGGVLRMSGNRNLYTNLRDGTGAERGAAVTAANALKVDGSAVTQPVSGTVTSNAGTGTRDVQGNVAHDAVDSGNPVKAGAKAVAHGANPTAVAAADRTDLYANRHGIQFVIGGHPNTVTLEAAYTAAQTDAAIVTVAGGLKIVVTAIAVVLDEATTVGVGFRVGFGAVNTPTTTGVVATHPGMVPGSGLTRGDGSGILGVGADGEDLRITSEVPTSGSLRVNVTYFLIES